MSFNSPTKSSWVDWPDHYKFFSFSLKIDPGLLYIERTTVTLFEFLGDVGGIIAVIEIVFAMLAEPFA